MNIYENCPVLENEKFILRLTEQKDCDDLLKVYSDKNALPFFNSDNCDGDNFYYETGTRMAEAMDFWKLSYENGWFVRLSIVDKTAARAVGTVELCLRASEDAFNGMGILRVDVKSGYEEAETLYSIISLIAPNTLPVWRKCWVAAGYLRKRLSMRWKGFGRCKKRDLQNLSIS